MCRLGVCSLTTCGLTNTPPPHHPLTELCVPCGGIEHMRELLASNGGQVAESAADANTTHLVVDENNVELLPPNLEVKDF